MEDWAAVAKAIDHRVRDLGWRQGELAKRSQISRNTVREIQHHLAERQRAPHTLQALSVALGWDADHLDSVLRGAGQQNAAEQWTDAERLAGLERQVARLADQVERMRIELRQAVTRFDGEG